MKTQPLAHQQCYRDHQEHSCDVVQQCRGPSGHQHQQDHHPVGLTTGEFGRADRHVFEHAGALQHPDHEHHPEQQEDDVPIDPGLGGIEGILRTRHPETENDRCSTERGGDPVHPLRGDQDIRADEDRDRHPRDRGHFSTDRISWLTVTTPKNSPASTTATKGTWAAAMTAAISTAFASPST